jgi:hypothetical protein
MEDRRKNLKLKNTDPPGGPPAKRPKLLVEVEVIDDRGEELEAEEVRSYRRPSCKKTRTPR